jgi:isoleucyl-tRNA synthetase
MERLFVDLNNVTGKSPLESVHHTEFPTPDLSLIDKALEERMEMAQKVSSMVLSLRKKSNIRVRQPLNKVMIPSTGSRMIEQLEAVKNLILSEVNVKELEYITDTSAILVKRIKPDFKRLGPKYGKLMKQIAESVNSFSQEDIGSLEREGLYKLDVNGQEVELSLADVEIISEDIPGWLVSNMGTLTVALDITITPKLWEEGIAREMINRIQNLRKEKGFEVTDKIIVELQRNDSFTEAVNNNLSYICSETLAQSFKVVDEIISGDTDFIELTDEISTTISVRKTD